MRLRGIFVLLLVGATAWSLPAAADHPLKGVALVIGESRYEHLQQLDNPHRDARAMDDMLDSLGFSVERVLDGDAERLRQAIGGFADAAKGADVALVYYSGHGIEAGGADYLVPTDTDLATPETAGRSLVPVDDVVGRLARTVPVTIVLLDACRTNSFPPGQLVTLPGSPAPVPVAASGLEAMRGPTPVASPGTAPGTFGVVIGFAASPGQAALDGAPDGNSPYAAALLKHFAAGGYSFGDLMTMVSEEVYLETKARQLPWVNSSLRRVLSFGRPPDDAAGGDDAAIRAGRRQLLLTIAGAPETTRHFVETVAASQGVPLDALYGMLQVLGVDTSGGQQQLEQQLEEGARQLKQFREHPITAVKSDPELQRLSALADEAEAEGAMQVALGFRERATARAEELARQRDSLEQDLKADRIEIASVFAEHAQAAALNFEFDVAAKMFSEAYEQVRRWDDVLALQYKWDQGQALKNHGDMKGDNAALEASIAAYGEALALAPRETRPDDWAGLQNNLGNALEALSTRRGDTAMLSRAAAAYDAALEVYDRGRVPLDWAMAQNNLGIVLVDLSLHQTGEGRLRDAVSAFEAALGPRSETEVPLDWATTENNLGTALQTLSERTGDMDYARRAIDAFRAALRQFQRDRTPLNWAMVQNNLGNALTTLGRTEHDAAALTQAVEAYREALGEYRQERVPLDWAMTQNNLGIALNRLSEVADDPTLTGQAVEAYRAALQEYTQDRAPLQWAMTQGNLGGVLRAVGYARSDVAMMRDAVTALTAALEVYSASGNPVEYVGTQQQLGSALLDLAFLTNNDPATLEAAAAADRAGIAALSFELDGARWAVLHQALALTLDVLSEARPEALADAVAAAEAARAAYVKLDMPVSPAFEDWLAGMRARLK